MNREDLAHAGRIARELVEERERQVDVEGFAPARDDALPPHELSMMAASYAIEPSWRSMAIAAGDARVPMTWPRTKASWKPRDDRRDLIRAGALILAAIERIDRAAERARPKDAAPERPLLADVRRGDVLVADARFTCLDPGQLVTVEQAGDGGLFVHCRDGDHPLISQVDAHGRLSGFAVAPRDDAP